MSMAWFVFGLFTAPPEPVATDDGTDGGAPELERRTVVVTGTRSARTLAETPIATSVVTRQDIEESGAQNVAEAIEETPGLQLTRGIGGTGIRLQGLDPSYTLILVDGQRVTGRVNGVVDLTRLQAEDIEQIEIVRGPGSVLYGADALAGTVNIITRRPTRPHEAEAAVAYGSFGTLDVTGRAAISRKRWASSITAGLHDTKGWDADPSDVTTTGPALHGWNVATAHELRELGPFSMRVRAEYLRRDAQRIDGNDSGAVVDRRNLTETLDATITPVFAQGPSELTLVGHYSLFRDQLLQDQRGATDLDQYERTVDHIGQLGAIYAHALPSNRLTTGIDAQLEQLVADRVDPGRVDRRRYAVFVQDEWTPSQAPRISIVPGMRVDVDSLFGAYPTPRIAIMVMPKPWITVRASYGRGFRAPSFRELHLRFANPSAGYVVRGNPALRPETSWGSQLSVELAPLRGLAIGANAFDNRLRDTIVVDTEAGTEQDGTSLFRYVNIGEATTRGAEGTMVASWRDTLRVEGSYTYLWTHDGDNDRVLPGRARHSGTAGLRLARARWGTSLRVRSAIFGTRTFFADDDGDRIENAQASAPFATLDLRLAQSLFADHGELFVGVDNVLDAGDATDNPIVPRSFYGGITMRY
ncbi:MAG: TonB-dependent receptor [Deltaproteobacteria bacterium]|nr:TonB-dependent receptor [Nannocystaceae bacterium]